MENRPFIRNFAPVIYPNNFERKLGFDEIRRLLKERCLSTLGKEKVDEMAFSTDARQINEWLLQVSEFRRLKEEKGDFPMQYFFDVREAVARIRLEGTHLEEDEVWDLRRSMQTIADIVSYLSRGYEGTEGGYEDTPEHPYPALYRLTEGVVTFPAIIRRIDSILDKFGKIKDSASITLAGIRHDLEKTQGSISRTLYTILHAAQKDGLVDKDAAPAMRDGRLVIPVAPQVKRRINGIVHDESATGKTVFIEPTEVVEANNKVRELEAAERREIIRILTMFTDEVRPHAKEILDSYQLLAAIDLIQAKAQWAELTKAYEPTVEDEPHIDWIRAIHPLLQLSLEKQGKKVVPLDIRLQGGPDREYEGTGARGHENTSVAVGNLAPPHHRTTVPTKTPSVLLDKVTGSVWYVPGGRSTIGQMIQDAGGNYPWADDDHSGSVSLPFEAVLEKAGEADVWLFRYSSDHDITPDELLSEHHGYDQFKAFRSGEIYGCDVERSLFYEESPFRPDWLLGDYIHILHPDIPNLPPLRYYKKVKVNSE